MRRARGDENIRGFTARDVDATVVLVNILYKNLKGSAQILCNSSTFPILDKILSPQKRFLGCDPNHEDILSTVLNKSCGTLSSRWANFAKVVEDPKGQSYITGECTRKLNKGNKEGLVVNEKDIKLLCSNGFIDYIKLNFNPGEKCAPDHNLGERCKTPWSGNGISIKYNYDSEHFMFAKLLNPRADQWEVCSFQVQDLRTANFSCFKKFNIMPTKASTLKDQNTAPSRGNAVLSITLEANFTNEQDADYKECKSVMRLNNKRADKILHIDQMCNYNTSCKSGSTLKHGLPPAPTKEDAASEAIVDGFKKLLTHVGKFFGGSHSNESRLDLLLSSANHYGKNNTNQTIELLINNGISSEIPGVATKTQDNSTAQTIGGANHHDVCEYINVYPENVHGMCGINHDQAEYIQNDNTTLHLPTEFYDHS